MVSFGGVLLRGFIMKARRTERQEGRRGRMVEMALSLYDIQFQSFPLTFSCTTKLHTLPSITTISIQSAASPFTALPWVPLDNLNSEYIAFSFPYPSSGFRKGGLKEFCYSKGVRYRMPPHFCTADIMRNVFRFLVSSDLLRCGLFTLRKHQKYVFLSQWT